MSSRPPERGAYGFTLRGADAGARGLLVDAPAAWPALELGCRIDAAPPPEREHVSDARARLLLAGGGWVELERAGLRAQLVLPERPAPGALVHPHLAPVAAVASRWLGRESFHAGAVVLGDGAWGLLGDKEAGKSSTLAALALAGHPVLTDDLLVIDGRRAQAGPRAIDLRSDASRRLGAGEPLGRVGLRDRWRLRLEPVAAEVELRGWIVLAWGDEAPSLTAIRGAARLQTIVPHRAVRLLPADPAALVGLSSLPCLELRRPRDWSSLAGSVRLLEERLAAGGG